MDIFSFLKKLKINGKGDTKHNRPIPDHDMQKIYEGAVYYHGLMNGSITDRAQIPKNWEFKPHYICQKYCIFLCLSHLGRRGRENINTLKISDFEIREHPHVGKFYKKIVGEATKNHKADSEDLEAGGIIPFKENEFGFNSGLFMQDYIAKLNPNCQL